MHLGLMLRRLILVAAVGATAVVVVILIQFATMFEPPPPAVRTWAVDGDTVQEIAREELSLPDGYFSCSWQLALHDGEIVELGYLGSEDVRCALERPPERHQGTLIIASGAGFVVHRAGTAARVIAFGRMSVANTYLWALGPSLETGDPWRILVGDETQFTSSDQGATWVAIGPNARLGY